MQSVVSRGKRGVIFGLELVDMDGKTALAGAGAVWRTNGQRSGSESFDLHARGDDDPLDPRSQLDLPFSGQCKKVRSKLLSSCSFGAQLPLIAFQYGPGPLRCHIPSWIWECRPHAALIADGGGRLPVDDVPESSPLLVVAELGRPHVGGLFDHVSPEEGFDESSYVSGRPVGYGCCHELTSLLVKSGRILCSGSLWGLPPAGS